MVRVLCLIFAFVFTARARDFDPRRDAFSFANETVFAYGTDEAGRLEISSQPSSTAFKHRCLCMVRATMQFWKFAHFDPQAPKVSAAEYRRRVRALFHLSAWRRSRGPGARIVFPGYTDLWSFSAANRKLVQEEMGGWFATYLRPGNWRMACPLTRLFQGTTARGVERDLATAPQALYLAKWPSMNHAVLAYSSEHMADGRLRFHVYDPNYPGQSAWLDYRPDRALFDFQKRFYWAGGDLRAFRIFLSPIQ